MTKEIELLAPGGDIESIKAAIVAGADAVYCGLNKFNARNRAENITFDDLNGILRLAHKNNCEVFLTLNINIVEPEIPDLINLLNKLVNTSIDGVIIQDFGLFYILSKYYKSLKIHASTQLTTHNEGQIKFLSKLNAERVNLSRELSGNEIKDLTTVAHQNKVLTEVFVHGSYCISYSGICYMSSVQSGNSGNRGRCSQPCRDEYETTKQGKSFPLNLKDNSAWFNLPELADAGVDSIKIEGRIKKFHYVHSIVGSYRKQLQYLYSNTPQSTDSSILYKVFNRDFSNAYLTGGISKTMFIDNPRDNSSTYLARLNGGTSPENIDKAELELYAEKGEMRDSIKVQIDKMSIAKETLIIQVSGEAGKPLCLSIKSVDKSFVVVTEKNLETKGSMAVDEKMLFKRLKAINETEYEIGEIDLNELNGQLYIPFKELTQLKNQILYILKNESETYPAIKLPALSHQKNKTVSPTLSILIDSVKDIALSEETLAKFYFQLPNDLRNRLDEMIELFTKHKTLIPWFPSVLIGADYTAAVRFLQQVKPSKIVLNNTGIAYEANLLGIPWIAGPFLNTTNSYTLKCLKENFNCAGAFISNELNKQQIQRIKAPDDFDLYYSIYHPIEMMSSRQCFFQTTSGCEKSTMDKYCMPNCSKTTSITNLKKETLFIKKTKGNYNAIYNEANFLNTKIITEISNRFTSFLVDLRTIKTGTNSKLSKSELLCYFHNCIQSENGAEELEQTIFPTTNRQYKKGI